MFASFLSLLCVTIAAATGAELSDFASEVKNLRLADEADAFHDSTTAADHEAPYQQLRSVATAATAAAAPQELRLCAVVHGAVLALPVFTMTWAHYHKAHYLSRGVNVTAKIIGTTEALPWATRAARAVVAETDNCDAYLGTAISSLAQVAALVVSKNWVDPASSSAFSDKTQYPFFTRINLDARQDGVVAATTFRALGITAVHTLCVDEAYGRSAAEGFTSTADRIDIISRGCFLPSAPQSVLIAQLRRIAAQKEQSQWVFLALLFSEIPRVLAATSEAGLNTTINFVSPRCETFYPGLICTKPTPNNTALQAAIAVRDSDIPYRTKVISEFVSVAGATSTAAALYTGGGAPGAVDAVELLVEAYVQFAAANPTIARVSDHQAALRDFMRANVSLPGSALGPLKLDKNGDRFLTQFQVLNVRSNNTYVQIGTLDRAASQVFTKTADVYLPSTGLVGLPLPTKVIPPSASSDGQSPILWAVIAVAAALPMMLAVVAIVVFLRGSGNARNLANAPTDATKPFSIVFTDIQASTTLWARLPELMGAALDTHNSLIRSQIQKHKGYEVKTIGDSFMVAFKDPEDAVLFTVAVQEALWKHSWGTLKFDEQYSASAAETQRTLEYVSAESPWHGLRVRIGASHGTGTITFDEVSKGYDYYGTVVNTAARTEGVAHGGQVLITEAAYEAMSNVEGLLFKDLGPQPLRGLPEPIVLYQWRPSTAPLSRRTYPPLRLDVENTANDHDTANTGTNGDTASAASSFHKGRDAGTVEATSLLTFAKAAVAAGPLIGEAGGGGASKKTDTVEAKYTMPNAAGTGEGENSPSPAPAACDMVTTAVSADGTDHDEAPTTGGQFLSSRRHSKATPADEAAIALQQSYNETVALLRPALGKKDRHSLFEKVAKAWRVQDPTTVKTMRHLVRDRESKTTLMLMAAILKGKAAAARSAL